MKYTNITLGGVNVVSIADKDGVVLWSKEEPSTDKTITFTPSEYTYDARYSIDGGDDVYVEEGTTATIVLPDTSTTISFNCLKGIGDWYINGVKKADQMSRPWNVNVADLNNGDVITCDISS